MNNLKKKLSFYLLGLFFLLSACSNEAKNISLQIEQPMLPVLTLKEANPVLKMTLIRTVPDKYTIQELTFSLDGTTDLNDISDIALYGADDNGIINTDNLLSPNQKMVIKSKILFKMPITIEADTFRFWVSVRLKDKIDLSHMINIKCESMTTDKGEIPLPPQSFPGLRTGVALRQHQQDNVHTSRIPGLATSKKGTLLAIYDARRESSRDLQGDIDIALNRSFDGGETWQSMQTVLDMKEMGGLPEKYNGVSDACILVDDKTGNIYVAGLWMHGVLDRETGKWIAGLTQDSMKWTHQWQGKGSQPGFDVKQTSQFLISKSDDDGQTWSKPVNITTRTKRPEWWLYAPAPGHGITMRDGTLLFPTQGRDKNGIPFSNITWSKDGGKNWTTSEPAYTNTTECMAVELENGSIMLNMRDNTNRELSINNGRRICVTSDLGKTWTEHQTSHKALIEPTCMASIHKHRYTENGMQKSIIIFVNPNSISSRDHITLKISLDDGESWPEKYWILLDEYKGRGYSCITSIDDNTIGILYESSQADLVFQKISLDDILNK